MKLRKYSIEMSFLLVISFCTLISCNRRAETNSKIEANPELIRFDLNTQDEELNKYSDVIEKITALKLETTPESLIGNIDKIYFDNDKIFVVDKYKAEGVFIFDTAGVFLNKIASKGKAPGEFHDIRDVTLDTEKKHLCLLDLDSRKINFYNYDGQFLYSQAVPFLFSSFEPIDSTTWGFSLNAASNNGKPNISNHYLVTGDLAGQSITPEFPYTESLSKFTYFNSNHLRKFGSTVMFYPRLSDTLYRIQSNKIVPVYTFDFKNQGFSENEKRTMDDEQYLELQNERKYFSGDYVELDDFAYFVIHTPNGLAKLFYSKKTGETVFGQDFITNNPLTGFINSPLTDYNSNTFICVAKVSDIMRERAILEEFKEGNKMISDLLMNWDENNNPVLLFFTLKEF